MLRRMFCLAAVCLIGASLAACTFATAAEAAPAFAAMAQSVDPGGSALGMTLALGAAGLTASPSLQATEALGATGATAPRVSLDDIDYAIAAENYFTAGAAANALEQPSSPALDLLTICILTTRNGFTVIGKSAPASPENFDADKGRTFARDDAVRQLWPLMGFALRERLASAAPA